MPAGVSNKSIGHPRHAYYIPFHTTWTIIQKRLTIITHHQPQALPSAMAMTDAAADDYWRDDDFSSARAQQEQDEDDVDDLSTAGPPATSTARKSARVRLISIDRSIHHPN